MSWEDEAVAGLEAQLAAVTKERDELRTVARAEKLHRMLTEAKSRRLLAKHAEARAAVAELVAGLKSLMDSSADQTFCFTEDCGRCQECTARALIAKHEVKP